MVIVILAGGFFLGFGLGFAAMALLAARGHRRQCEKRREARAYSPRQSADRAFPAEAEAAGASCRLSTVP